MKRGRSRSDWIMAGLCLLTFSLVTWASNPETGIVAGITLGVFVTIILTKRETRKESLAERRFWLIIAILAAIHILAISLIRVPELQFGLLVLPFALADGFAMWWLINWIERRFPLAGDTGSDE